ncbi:MAG: sensor histidine kinase [Lachnospiraceae bacterium]|uniref:histidine kinase n=1 Tax=Candidatus Weimeria bifida TaxID=2599074 RepID=A0A6N7IXF7_9FIRM|nr:sensor histidine kinase [Candidatus Weimeria bifida]RRF97188.1 MAG: sensor histidine kinase [Lachnospiraceae bacterium]
MKKRLRRWFDNAFRNSRLINKIMIIYVMLSAIPILLLGAFLVVQQRQMMQRQRADSVRSALMQASAAVTSDVRVYNNLSDYVAYNRTVSDALTSSYNSRYELFEQYEKTIDPILQSPSYFSPDIEKLKIYLSNNAMPSHGVTIGHLSEISDSAWYKSVKKSLNQSVTWIIDNKARKIRSVREMPLMEMNGEKGILYIEVNYNSLFDSFDKICQEGQGVSILDKNGDLIYEKNNGLKHNVLKPGELMSGKSRIGGYYVQSDKIAGLPLTAYMYGKNNFSIMFNLQLLFVLAIYLAIVVATLFIASKLFQRYVVSDITKLEENMHEVAKGNRTLMVVSDSKDEIGGLIRDFGSMLAEINRLIKENYENKLALRKAEMKALQAQINPHFLYNSLSLINWKAIEKGADDISDVTLALSRFYRTSLNRGKNVLTVEQEIENVKSYIKIQSYMHDNSFDTVIDVDEDILPYETLNLLLQPLVENAIDHGIDMKEDGRGFIKIIGRQTDGTITLTVEDNGVGMDEETAESILNFKSKGYGVANVNQRIELFYGRPYGLKIKSIPGKGTVCTVTIPKKMPS